MLFTILFLILQLLVPLLLLIVIIVTMSVITFIIVTCITMIVTAKSIAHMLVKEPQNCLMIQLINKLLPLTSQSLNLTVTLCTQPSVGINVAE